MTPVNYTRVPRLLTAKSRFRQPRPGPDCGVVDRVLLALARKRSSLLGAPDEPGAIVHSHGRIEA